MICYFDHIFDKKAISGHFICKALSAYSQNVRKFILRYTLPGLLRILYDLPYDCRKDANQPPSYYNIGLYHKRRKTATFLFYLSMLANFWLAFFKALQLSPYVTGMPLVRPCKCLLLLSCLPAREIKKCRLCQASRQQLFRFTAFQPSSLSGVRPSRLSIFCGIRAPFTTFFQTFLAGMPPGGNHCICDTCFHTARAQL